MLTQLYNLPSQFAYNLTLFMLFPPLQDMLQSNFNLSFRFTGKKKEEKKTTNKRAGERKDTSVERKREREIDLVDD